MDINDSNLVYSYYVDSDCRIQSVDENWKNFARQNDSSGLIDNVIGKSLLQFISNEEVRMIHRMLLDKVLSAQKPVAVSLRCDSAELRREMELRMMPESDSLVKFACYTLLEVPHPEPLAILGSGSKSDKFALMCSWCKKVETDGQWVELEEAVRNFDWLGANLPPSITHGICANCSADISELLFENEASADWSSCLDGPTTAGVK